jgi:hypothetical protein
MCVTETVTRDKHTRVYVCPWTRTWRADHICRLVYRLYYTLLFVQASTLASALEVVTQVPRLREVRCYRGISLAPLLQITTTKRYALPTPLALLIPILYSYQAAVLAS